MRYFLQLLIAVALAVGCCPPAAAAPRAQRSEAFQPAACMFDLPPGVRDGEDIECGYLTVPEHHARPDGRTIRLAVAIIKARGENPAPDPLVMLQGGPGGSTIDFFTQVLFLPNGLRLLNDRDIVLFDQRGTLYSEPALLCTPEQSALVERTIEQRLSDEEAERLSMEAMLECRERLVGEGIDLSAYDSLENAADIEALRVALGYEQINLYGVSYGTLLALHVMRNHPQGLRSVILDAVVPAQTNFIPEAPRSQDRAFGEMFAACAADPACSEAFPDLESRLFALVDRLNQEPARVPVTDPETGKSYQMVMDGDDLLALMFQLLYATNVLPAWPLLVDRVAAEDYTFLSRVAAQIIFDRTNAIGMYYSVICAEDADFTIEDVDLSGVRPVFAEDAERGAQALMQLCERWDVELLPASVDEPVVSEIPTLVLNGRFDPITPPAFGEQAARTLPNSYVFTFNNTGHGAATMDACAVSVVLQFLEDPARPPDASCIAENPAPKFLTPANLLMTPSLAAMLSWLEGQNLWQPALLFGALLVLLTPFVYWPLAWLVRVVGGQQAVRRPGMWRTRAFAALSGLGALGLVIGLVVVIFVQAFENELALLFGAPRWSAPLFALPPLLALLAAGLLVSALLGWRPSAGWSGWQRVYYTLLALAALAFVGVLASTGMLTALV